MAEILIAIIDNGSGKRGGTCDDCGIALRYEYHTSDGGRYGCECIHRHIHNPDWMTFKAERDAKLFAKRQRDIERQLKVALEQQKPLRYTVFHQDGSGYLNIGRYGEQGAAEVIAKLLDLGWTKEIYRTKEGWTISNNRSRNYLINPPWCSAARHPDSDNKNADGGE